MARALLDAFRMTTLDVIDTTSLDTVTGGTAQKVPASSGGNSALVSQLASLQGSIKDLATQKPQSAFGGMNTVLLFAALAANRPAASSNVVYVRRGCW
jgi:hypothetical protein